MCGGGEVGVDAVADLRAEPVFGAIVPAESDGVKYALEMWRSLECGAWSMDRHIA